MGNGERGHVCRRALVIDDQASLRLLVRAVLEPHDYVVDAAPDGLEACNYVKRYSYDAIVCDVSMPRMDGSEFYRVLSEIDYRQAERLIFVTGFSLDPETRRALLQTGRPLLHKPFGIDELQKAVEQVALAHH